MEKQEQLLPNPRRNILQMAVAGVLEETGFAKSDKQCVESLTEVNIYEKFAFELILNCEINWILMWTPFVPFQMLQSRKFLPQ